MIVNEYRVLSECVEEGVATGLRRYNKYADAPLTAAQEQALTEHLEQEVLNAICEYFNFSVDTPPDPL